MTPDPGFKVTVVLKGEYLQSDAFYRHSNYIGRNIGTLSIGNLAIHLTTPQLLRKPCKLVASVARVCQRQLGFLVVVTAWSTRPFLCSGLPLAIPVPNSHALLGDEKRDYCHTLSSVLSLVYSILINKRPR